MAIAVLTTARPARKFLRLLRRKPLSGRGTAVGSGRQISDWLVCRSTYRKTNPQTTARLWLFYVRISCCAHRPQLLCTVAMKDWFSFFGVVTGKYNSVNQGAATAGQQASWRTGQSSLRIRRRSSVFVNQLFKETGSGKQRRVRPRCKCSL
jgi:hypothetical protein